MGRKFAILTVGIVVVALLGAHRVSACELKRAPKAEAETRKSSKHIEGERWRALLPRSWGATAAPSRRFILQ